MSLNMFTTTAPTIKVDPNTRSEHVGILVSRSGNVVLDQYFTIDTSTVPELAKFLVVDAPGVLVYQYYDGTYGYISNAVAGFWYPIAAIRVVTSHTFNNAGLLTTTATGINWYGGA